MRLSVVLLLLSLAGVILGAALIGVWAIGCAVIFDSLVTGVYALQRDDGTGAQPQVRHLDGVPADVRQFIERVRGAA